MTRLEKFAAWLRGEKIANSKKSWNTRPGDFDHLYYRESKEPVFRRLKMRNGLIVVSGGIDVIKAPQQMREAIFKVPRAVYYGTSVVDFSQLEFYGNAFIAQEMRNVTAGGHSPLLLELIG